MKNSDQQTDKRPLPVLRELAIDESVDFPRSQYPAINGAIYYLKITLGWIYTRKQSSDGSTLNVKRVA